MIKTLQNTLKQDKERFTVPKSVQDIIPIRRIWPDGVFQFGSKYSKTLRFSDINYAIASKEDKTAMFLSYSELLNAARLLTVYAAAEPLEAALSKRLVFKLNALYTKALDNST